MATIEVEKRIRELDPAYLKDLLNYLDYLLFLQKKQEQKNGKVETKPAVKAEAAVEKPAETDIPERLRIARQFAGDAPHPHFPTS